MDQDRRPGRFVLTGSANLLLVPTVTESLAGRMEMAQLHPLTESEKARAPGPLPQRPAERRDRAGHPARGGARRAVAAGQTGRRRLSRAADAHARPLPAMAQAVSTQHHRSGRAGRGAGERCARELARLLELLALRSAGLLNTSNLANTLGLHRSTVNHYVAVLERLFLVRRLPAWRRNPAKRLIRTPKVHLLDTGLAATLADLTAYDWLGRRDRMGHLLASFVVQQLIAQATWTEPDLRFWHYRDKDRVEVDVVITRGEKTWGIEVKAARWDHLRRRERACSARSSLRRGFRVRRAALRRPRSSPACRQAHPRRAAERIVGAVGTPRSQHCSTWLTDSYYREE